MHCINCKNDHHVRKHGWQNGKQRYYCTSCGSTFSEGKNISEMRKRTIRTALHLIIEGYDVKEISKLVGMSVYVVRNWERKYLRALKSIVPGSQSESFIEVRSLEFRNNLKRI